MFSLKIAFENFVCKMAPILFSLQCEQELVVTIWRRTSYYKQEKINGAAANCHNNYQPRGYRLPVMSVVSLSLVYISLCYKEYVADQCCVLIITFALLYCQTSEYKVQQILKLKCFLSRLAVVFAQSIEATC